jgi:hypothetical protein
MLIESAVRSFPVILVFPDVDPSVLARDEGISLDRRSLLDGAWANYMRRVLPPVGGMEGWGATRNPTSARLRLRK